MTTQYEIVRAAFILKDTPDFGRAFHPTEKPEDWETLLPSITAQIMQHTEAIGNTIPDASNVESIGMMRDLVRKCDEIWVEIKASTEKHTFWAGPAGGESIPVDHLVALAKLGVALRKKYEENTALVNGQNRKVVGDMQKLLKQFDVPLMNNQAFFTTYEPNAPFVLSISAKTAIQNASIPLFMIVSFISMVSSKKLQEVIETPPPQFVRLYKYIKQLQEDGETDIPSTLKGGLTRAFGKLESFTSKLGGTTTETGAEAAAEVALAAGAAKDADAPEVPAPAADADSLRPVSPILGPDASKVTEEAAAVSSDADAVPAPAPTPAPAPAPAAEAAAGGNPGDDTQTQLVETPRIVAFTPDALRALLKRIRGPQQAVKDYVHTYLKSEDLFRQALNYGVEVFHDLKSEDKERSELVYLSVPEASPRQILDYLIKAAQAQAKEDSDAKADAKAAAPEAAASTKKRGRKASVQTKDKRRKTDTLADTSTLPLPNSIEEGEVREDGAADPETMAVDSGAPALVSAPVPVTTPQPAQSLEEGEIPEEEGEIPKEKGEIPEKEEGEIPEKEEGEIPKEKGEIPKEVADTPFGPHRPPPPPADAPDFPPASNTLDWLDATKSV